MISRIFLSAIGAGVMAGLIAAVIGHLTTTPLIVEAEKYENAGGHHSMAPAGIERATYRPQSASEQIWRVHSDVSAETDDQAAWAPTDGLERTAYTALTTAIIGIGFALIVVALMVLRGDPVTARRGLMWGIAGFAAVSLAPALGLPPELPGAATADVYGRQIWWFACIVATGGGIAIMAFTSGWAWRAGAIVLILAPHVIGAPHPPSYTSAVPSELTGHFVAATLVVAAVFWAVLGWAAGTFYARLGGEPSG